jgi:hypothetical protein
VSRRCNPPRAAGPRRLPRADEPLRDPHDAVALIAAVASRPVQHEVVVVLLDAARRGGPVFVVEPRDDGGEPDVVQAVIELVDRLPEVDALVIGSIRPGGGIEDADQYHWLEAVEAAGLIGVVAVDWFVLDGRTATSLAVRSGSPSRW